MDHRDQRPSIDELIRRLSVCDDKTRSEAARELGERSEPTAFDALAKVVCDSMEAPATRAVAAIAIGKTAHPDVEDVLWKIVTIRQGGDVVTSDSLRGAALAALRRRKGLPELSKLVHVASLSEREWIVAIGETLDSRAVGAMTAILGDEAAPLLEDDHHCLSDADDRTATILAALPWLGRIGGPDAARTACACLDDEDGQVVEAATDALVAIGAEATNLVVERLVGDDVDTSRRAALVLARQGDQRAIPCLAEWVSARGDHVAFRPLLALGEPGFVALAEAVYGKEASTATLAKHVLADKPRFFPMMGEVLDRDEGYAADVCATIFGMSKDPAALPHLARAMAKKTPGLGITVALALGDFGGARAIAALKTAVDAEDNEVREVVAEVLERLE